MFPQDSSQPLHRPKLKFKVKPEHVSSGRNTDHHVHTSIPTGGLGSHTGPHGLDHPQDSRLPVCVCVCVCGGGTLLFSPQVQTRSKNVYIFCFHPWFLSK